MALNLGAMIQAARTQQNPAGDAIANFQNQQDRQRAEEQRHFNNLSSILGIASQNGGQIGSSQLDTGKMLNAMGMSGMFL